MLLVMVLAFSTVLIASLAKSNPETERQQKTLKALAQAKQALIARAVVQGDTGSDSYHRPGTLPCPDKNFFGNANSGNASGSCVSSGETSIGRLPWKSLGMAQLYDGHGETLWYAINDPFRNPTLSKEAINSDAKGSLLLYAADGSTLLTPNGEELAAVIFAPGPPLPGQDRVAQPDAASSYLEAFNGKNNAKAAGPFIMGPVLDSSGNLVVNDLVIGISARELIAALEKRALNEAQNALKNYVADMGSYPNPAPPNGANCDSPASSVKSLTISQCTSDGDICCAGDSGTCYGRLPEDALSSYVAPWFWQNGWGRVMVYAVNDSGIGCPASLNVGGVSKNYVLIAPGAARNGQSRPSSVLSDYLEDPGNADGWSADPDFLVPGINSNDQMRTDP
jgi:type II secretory pathway pseudopilin PulG